MRVTRFKDYQDHNSKSYWRLPPKRQISFQF